MTIRYPFAYIRRRPRRLAVTAAGVLILAACTSAHEPTVALGAHGDAELAAVRLGADSAQAVIDGIARSTETLRQEMLRTPAAAPPGLAQ